MFGALKTVEEKNLFASFGLVDGLSENELDDINGGFTINITCTFSIFGGSKGDSTTTISGNDSGNSGGSSGSSASSSSSAS